MTQAAQCFIDMKCVASSLWSIDRHNESAGGRHLAYLMRCISFNNRVQLEVLAQCLGMKGLASPLWAVDNDRFLVLVHAYFFP